MSYYIVIIYGNDEKKKKRFNFYLPTQYPLFFVNEYIIASTLLIMKNIKINSMAARTTHYATSVL